MRGPVRSSSLPPCGGGLGRGVTVTVALLAPPSPALPHRKSGLPDLRKMKWRNRGKPRWRGGESTPSTQAAASRSRRRLARVSHEHRPSKDRGRRESRVPNAPIASRANEKSTRASHHRFIRIIRLSPRDGFIGFLRALPGEPGFLATVAGHDAKTSSAGLTPASGRQDHTSSPHASRRSSVDTIRVHRIPPRVRDDREPPLSVGRDGRIDKAVSTKRRSEIFFEGGLDNGLARRRSDLPVGQIKLAALQSFRGASATSEPGIHVSPLVM
jgi:hypothetical protein